MNAPLKINNIIKIAELINDHKGENTIALDLRGLSSWTDFFIISTVQSFAHLKGIVKHVMSYFEENETYVSGRQKNIADDSWVLIDCGTFVIHLMEKETREFYELEKLWFSASVCYQSSKSS